jgi:hypothetical protein
VQHEAHQREAVGVQAARRQAKDDISRYHVRSGQKAVPLDSADRETRQIDVARRVVAGHFGRLPADQGAARFAAAVGDALQCGQRATPIQPAGGIIVEEEQGFGALADQVVDAHGDEVDAGGVQAPGLGQEAQLGADAVRGRDEQRVAQTRAGEVEDRAEAADAALCAGPSRGAHERSDGTRQRVAGVDVDARAAVATCPRFAFGHDHRIQG